MAFAQGIQAPHSVDRVAPSIKIKDPGDMVFDHYGMEAIHSGPVKMVPPQVMQAKFDGQSFSVRAQTKTGLNF